MSVNEVDVELLISEIEKKPAIWDVSSEQYKDRIQKKNAWNDICRNLFPTFEDMEVNEKNQTGSKLQMKWRSLRDAFCRSLRDQRTLHSRYGAKKRRKYVFANKMSFLHKNIKINKRSTSDECPGVKKEDVYQIGQLLNKPSSSKNKPVSQEKWPNDRKLISLESKLLSILDKPKEPEDEDMAFFKSLLTSVKKFDEDQKLEFRLEVINVIKKIKNSKNHIPPVGFLSNP